MDRTEPGRWETRSKAVENGQSPTTRGYKFSCIYIPREGVYMSVYIYGVCCSSSLACWNFNQPAAARLQQAQCVVVHHLRRGGGGSLLLFGVEPRVEPR